MNEPMNKMQKVASVFHERFKMSSLQREGKMVLSALRNTRESHWFIIFLLLYFALSLWTLGLTPTVWEDEVALIAMAISDFPGPPYISTIEGIQSTYFNWTYYLIMQLFLKIFGVAPTAGRLLSLLAGLLATIIFRAILLRLSVRPLIATSIALLLLTDSAFSQSLRGARADPLSIAFALAAVFFMVKAELSQHPKVLVSLASILIVASLSTWPTSPLVLILIPASLLWSPSYRSKRIIGRNLLWLAITGSLIAGALVFISLWPEPSKKLRAFQTAASISQGVFSHSSPWSIPMDIMKIYSRQPWMAFAFGFSLVLSIRFRSWRGLSSLIAVILPFGIIACTGFYVWRYVYILPGLLFLMAFVSEDLVSWLENRQMLHWKRICTGLLILCVFGSFVVEPCARTAFAFIQRDYRNYQRVEKALEGLIKPGDRVFGLPQAFYAVEQQGGHMVIWFCTSHKGRLVTYHGPQVKPIDSRAWQLLDDNPAAISFLGTIDLVVASYETVEASELNSKDGSIRFTKVGDLPPLGGRSGRFFPMAKGYSFAVFRRSSGPKISGH